jgi:hypothetical protein
MFTFLYLLLFLSLFLGNKSLATTSSTSQPRFISQGHTYRAVVGETLTLPCEVENIGTCPSRFSKTFLFASIFSDRIEDGSGEGAGPERNICNNLIDVEIDMFKIASY